MLGDSPAGHLFGSPFLWKCELSRVVRIARIIVAWVVYSDVFAFKGIKNYTGASAPKAGGSLESTISFRVPIFPDLQISETVENVLIIYPYYLEPI